MNNILQLILGIIFGALTSYLIPLLVAYFLSTKSKQKILGKWIAEWQPKINDSKEWITEDVTIKKDFFRGLKFESANNSEGFNWIGYGKVIEKRYIIGEWNSLNLSAYANGAFMYTIAARGNYMCGYDVAPDDSGKNKYRAFCIARSQEDLEKAKIWLKEDMS